MLEPDPPFRPVRTRDGYLPLEDVGLIGDCCAPGPAHWACCRSKSTRRRASSAGNYPQAFSHIGVIASGVTLARARAGELR